MPAPSFLSKLPKPVLFGLYGAVGGLLGALAFGELAWHLLRPPAPPAPVEPPPPPPQVAVSASPKVALYPGTENVIEVQVARDRFDGPVTVAVASPVAGLGAAPVTVAAGQTAGQAKLAAAADAKPGTYPLTLTATASPAGQTVSATAGVEAVVTPLPPRPPRLSVTASPKVHVLQGDKNAFGVEVARDGFDGAVTVRFVDVPDDVTIEPVTLAPKDTKADVVVSAAKKRAPGEWKVGVRAEAGTGAKAVTAAADTAVRVQPIPEPQPQLVLTTSPDVHVYARAKNTFAVKVARDGFDKPVKVTFAGLPENVRIDPVTIPAGATEATATVIAGKNAEKSVQKLDVTAEAPVGESGLKAKAQLTLRVGVLPPDQIAKVDVVFVLDVTGSMGPFVAGVKDGIKEFAGELEFSQIDARLALLAFGDRPLGEEPDIPKFGPDNGPFTDDIDAFKAAVSKIKMKGGGDEPESSLDGLAEAAGFKFRRDATRVLLLITDAPPKIPDKTTKSVAACVAVLKKQKIDQVHLVCREVDLTKFYKVFADDFRGKHFDLLRVTKKGEKFAKILPELGKAIEATIESKPAPKAEVAGGAPVAVVPKAEAAPTAATPPVPPPAVLPGVAAAPAVTPAPQAPPPKIEAPAVKGVQSSEQYDAGSSGRLVLAVGVWTGALSGLLCLALLAGQHHYLRGSLPSAGGALAGVGGGLAVGLLGGAAGQGLFLLADTDSAALAALFRVLGWALLGGLAGAGLALFIPNLKLAYGLLGGAAGGAAGALAFLAVSSVTGDLLGRLVGGLILGFCVGLMVAVVEAAFRSAWLEVRYGEREVVTVNLGAEPVKVGGDSKLCTVWARGAAPVALRFWLRDGQVMCEDATTRTEAAVGDGTTRAAGGVTVVVRTGSGTAPAAPATPPRPAAPARRPADDDDLLPLPMEPAPARPAAESKSSPRRPAPSEEDDPLPLPPLPAAPKVPAPVPARKPAIAGQAKPGEGCPQCGRKVPGEVGQRYCMLCDETF
jgi:hypothetical protein